MKPQKTQPLQDFNGPSAQPNVKCSQILLAIRCDKKHTRYVLSTQEPTNLHKNTSSVPHGPKAANQKLPQSYPNTGRKQLTSMQWRTQSLICPAKFVYKWCVYFAATFSWSIRTLQTPPRRWPPPTVTSSTRRTRSPSTSSQTSTSTYEFRLSDDTLKASGVASCKRGYDYAAPIFLLLVQGRRA